MQDRIARIDETSCNARPDHTFGSFATGSTHGSVKHVRFTPDSGEHAARSETDADGPCVDGSGLARAFFTFAALVGAAMCSAF